MHNKIATDKAPGAIGPYSQGIEIDNLVFTSGQLGADPTTGELAAGVEAQTEQALQNLKAVLAGAKLTLANVIKTTVFIDSMDDFTKINNIYAQYFAHEPLPARSCVEVAKLPKGALVEIEAIALKK
jgi:endoribonuclease L-PSP, putative